MEKGLIDLAFVREPIDETKFNSIHFIDEQWAAFFNKKHILSQKSSEVISLRELSKEELIVPSQRVEEIENWFKAENLTADIRCSVSPLSIALSLIKNNLGVAILPESTIKSIENKNEILLKKLDKVKNRNFPHMEKKLRTFVSFKKFYEFLSE